MAGPLLVRPLPLRGEGLRGYFLRVADANGLLPDLDLFLALRATTGHAGMADAAVIANAGRLGLSTSDLTRLGCLDSGADANRCLHAGHSIALQHLRTRQCAFCPECLARQTAIWADWELRAQVACPDHGCWLVDACPRCAKPIGWRRSGMCACNCGFDLRRVRTTSAPAVAVALAAALRHRVLDDLSTESSVSSLLPDFFWRCSLNELLGIFHLFRASRLRQLVASPPDLVNATDALQGQVAVANKVASLVECWPRRWHEMLEELRSVRDGISVQLTTRLITSREAAAPYLFLQRPLWSPASAFPKELRAELDGQLHKRRIFVGPRRYFIDGAAERHVRRSSSDRLRYLLATRGNARRAESDDRLSAAAVKDLFSATDYQMAVLRRLGVLKGARWTTVRELELAMCKLARHSRLRRPTVDRDVVPLSEFSLAQGDELELHLRNVMAGSTPSVYWGSTQIPGLRNLFIPSSYAKAARTVGLEHQH
jgi:hypothetical protein